MGPKREMDISEIDAFLVQDKRLQLLPGIGWPEWGQSTRRHEIDARWNIEDDQGVRAHLRFRCRKPELQYPSISLIFRKDPIWRIEIAPATARHWNPASAQLMGLPPYVDGSHEHGWPDNKEYVQEAVVWDIPYRRAIPTQIKKLSQAIPWFAKRINLGFTPDQRGFEVPPQGELGLFQ